MSATTTPPEDPWMALRPEHRAKLVERVTAMFPDESPEDFWRTMEPAHRAEWLWHEIHPSGDGDSAVWEAMAASVSANADPETQAYVQRTVAPTVALPDGEGPVSRIRLTPASQIKIRRVRWVWEDRLPMGELSLLAGRESLGKSTVAYTLAAQLTAGTMEGEFHGHPKSVLVAATEDSWEHTIVPRLRAAGADLDRVYRVDVMTDDDLEAALCLPSDIGELEIAVKEMDAGMVLLDPLISRLSARLDTHKDQEVRQGLEPLTAFAKRATVCVLGIIHVSKAATADALTSIMGSRAFTAVPRSVLYAVKNPSDETTRLLGHAKSNLGPQQHTLTYRIVGVMLPDEGDGPIPTSKVEFVGTIDRSIDDVVAEVNAGGEFVGATEDAMDWLQAYLEDQGGAKASRLIKEEGKREGHSDRTLKRAAQRLKLRMERSGRPPQTVWYLPEPDTGQDP